MCQSQLVNMTASTEAPPEQISKMLSFRPAFDSLIHQNDRPLVLIYGWLVAKSRHIHKYGDFYLTKGFDVLHIMINSQQMLWPPLTKDMISQIVDFVHERKKQPVLIHGFSIGAYLLGETLLKIADNRQTYGNIEKRIIGQIFDSPVNFNEIPVGFSKAVTPYGPAQTALKGTIETYLKVFYNQATKHYIRSSEEVQANNLKIPSLVLYSSVDPVASVEFIEEIMQQWRDKGIVVTHKRWEDSPHVSHFLHHPVEYIQELNCFLDKLGIGERESLVRRARAVHAQL